MKIAIILVMIVQLLSRCKQQTSFIPNDMLIESIDKSDISVTQYKILIDSNHTALDTVQIQVTKYNDNQEKNYQEIIYWVN